MRIFVTGGTGFIGTHVVRKLMEEEHDLLLLIQESEKPSFTDYHKKITAFVGDLSNIDAWKDVVKKFQPDVTIHMAWGDIPNYDYKTSMRNLIYGLNLIVMLAEIGCKRVLCTGSCWEYGQKSGKLDEDSVVKPSSAFTAAKHALHLMGREIARENHMEFIWTRLFYVYGPGQKSHSLIPHIITSIRLGNHPNIKTPHSRNDFVYVEDVAEAISLLIVKKVKGEVYNIGSGYSTEILHIINAVYRLYGFNERHLSESGKPADSPPVDFWADISRIKADVGWKPKFSIEKGIETTIEYFRKIH